MLAACQAACCLTLIALSTPITRFLRAEAGMPWPDENLGLTGCLWSGLLGRFCFVEGTV